MDPAVSFSNRPKHLLLCSCGVYPQVITEVVYALSQQHQPVELDEIHVVTTQVGMEHIQTLLLDEQHGYFYKLCREYELQNTHFELRHVSLLKDAKGVFLDDVQTIADNELVADTITEMVRYLTAQEDTVLHVSLAGGRRTLAYYLGYALSLFGRPHDRLYHVVVTHNFEADDEFFYPNRTPTFITDRRGHRLNTQDAKVNIADIPYVRLRSGIPQELLEGKTTFVQAVKSLTKVAPVAHLEIWPQNRRITMNSVNLDLSPLLFAWYSWIVTRLHSLGPQEGSISAKTEAEEFLTHTVNLYGENYSSLPRIRRGLKDGFTIDYISEKNSLINKKISGLMGFTGRPFRIHAFGKRPHTQYSLLLDHHHIVFVGSKINL